MSDSRHFKSFTKAFLEYCHNVDAPESYKYWSALSVIAGAIERKVWYTTGKIWWYPNLYVFLVGERSTRKSTSSKVAVGLLKELSEANINTAQMNIASLIRDMSELSLTNSFEYFGKHYKHASMFIFASEAAMVLGDMYANGSPTKYLVEVYNCGDDGPSDKPIIAKSTMKDKQTMIYNPCVNILACSTPAWLMTELLNPSDVEGGFGSRILFVVHQGEYDSKDEVPTADGLQDESLRLKLVEELTSMSKLRGNFTATPEWRQAIGTYSKQHKLWMAEHKHSDKMLTSCLARKTDSTIYKLSMLLSLNESNAMVLEARHAHEAWALLTNLEANLPYAFGKFGVTDEMRHTFDIMSYAKDTRKAELDLRDLCRVFSKVHSTKRIREGLKDLEAQGKITLNPTKSKYPYELVYTIQSY